MDCERSDLHDVSNIQEVHPLTLIQVPEEDPHVDRVGQGLVVYLRLELFLLVDDPL